MPSPALATKKLQAGKVTSLASLAVSACLSIEEVTEFRGDDGHGRLRRMNCSLIFLRWHIRGYPVRWRSACGEVCQLAVHRPPVRLCRAYHRGWTGHLRPSSATGDEATLMVCLMALCVDVGDDERLALPGCAANREHVPAPPCDPFSPCGRLRSPSRIALEAVRRAQESST